MMMCHPTKFGCKKISSSIDVSETVIYLIIWALIVTLNLKTANLIFLHDTRVHDGESPYQVWLQKLQRLRKYRWVEHSLEFLILPVTLTTTEQSNLLTGQSILWCTIKPSLVAKGSAVQIMYWKVIFWLYNPSQWPWPWRQQTNIFLRQFCSWWCITVPSLVV